MERVTVEQAGERIVLEVPDGTTDEQIQQHLSGGQQQPKQSLGQQLKNEVASVKSAGDVGTVLSKGLVGGTLGAPVDLMNMGLQGADYVANKLTGAVRPEALPYLPKLASEKPVGGSQWINEQMGNAGIVGQEQRPLLEAGASLIPVAPSAAKGAYNVGKAAVNGVREGAGFVKGTAKGAFINPEGTSLVPMGESHYTPASVADYMAGKIGREGLVEQPTSEILKSPIDKAMLKIAGDQVPVAGKVGEATGERIAADYSSPWKVLTDVASTGMFGIPLNAAKRGAQAVADRYLANKLQLSPEFHTKLANDVAPVSPQSFSEPAPRLKQPSTEFVAENERKLAELRARAQQEQPAPVAPVETPKAAAIKTVVEEAPTTEGAELAKKAVTNTLTPNDVLATIRARKSALDPKADYKKMVEEAKAAPPQERPTGPVAPVLTPDQKLAQLRAGLQQEPRNALFEQEANPASVQTGGRSSEPVGPVAPGPTIGEERRLQAAIDRNPHLMRDPRFRKANNMEFISPQEETFHNIAKQDVDKNGYHVSNQVRDNGVNVEIVDIPHKNKRQVTEVNPETGEVFRKETYSDAKNDWITTSVDKNGTEYVIDHTTGDPWPNLSIKDAKGREIQNGIQGGELYGDSDLMRELGVKNLSDLEKIIDKHHAEVESRLSKPKNDTLSMRTDLPTEAELTDPMLGTFARLKGKDMSGNEYINNKGTVVEHKEPTKGLYTPTSTRYSQSSYAHAPRAVNQESYEYPISANPGPYDMSGKHTSTTTPYGTITTDYHKGETFVRNPHHNVGEAGLEQKLAGLSKKELRELADLVHTEAYDKLVGLQGPVKPTKLKGKK